MVNRRTHKGRTKNRNFRRGKKSVRKRNRRFFFFGGEVITSQQPTEFEKRKLKRIKTYNWDLTNDQRSEIIADLKMNAENTEILPFLSKRYRKEWEIFQSLPQEEKEMYLKIRFTDYGFGNLYYDEDLKEEIQKKIDYSANNNEFRNFALKIGMMRHNLEKLNLEGDPPPMKIN